MSSVLASHLLEKNIIVKNQTLTYVNSSYIDFQEDVGHAGNNLKCQRGFHLSVCVIFATINNGTFQTLLLLRSCLLR